MVEQEAGLVEAIGRKEEYEAGFRGLLTDLELAEDLREQAEARADDLQAAALMPPPPPPPPPPAGDETASQQPTTIGSRAAAIEQQVLGLRDETEALRAELATAVAGKAAAEGQLAAGRRLAETQQPVLQPPPQPPAGSMGLELMIPGGGAETESDGEQQGLHQHIMHHPQPLATPHKVEHKAARDPASIQIAALESELAAAREEVAGLAGEAELARAAERGQEEVLQELIRAAELVERTRSVGSPRGSPNVNRPCDPPHALLPESPSRIDTIVRMWHQ